MLFMPTTVCTVLQALLRSFTRHGEMRMHLHIASGCFARASSVDVRKPAHGCSRLFKKKHAADILINSCTGLLQWQKDEAPD